MASRVQRGRARTRPISQPQVDPSQRIPQRILKNAKEATDVQPLMDAFDILTEENFTLELVDIFLHHMNPERMISPRAPPTVLPWIPGTMQLPREEQEYYDQLCLQEAWSHIALFCGADALFLIQVRCPEDLREETTRRIAPHIGELITWFHYLQSSTSPLQDPRSHVYVGDPTKPCEAVWRLFESNLSKLDFKPQLLSYIDEIVDLAISAWLATDPRIKHGPFNMKCWRYYRMTAPGECPIMEFIMTLLEIEPIRQRIFDMLLGTRGLLRRVVDAAILRCDFVFTVQKSAVEEELSMTPIFKEHSAVGAMLTYLQRTLETMQQLCEHPEVSRKVFQSDFFEHLLRAVNRWLAYTDAKEDAEQRVQAVEIANLSQALILLQRHVTGDHWKLSGRALESLVRGGHLEVVIEAVQSPLPRARKLGHHLLQLLQVQCDIRAASSGAIHSKLKDLRGNNCADPGFLASKEVHGYWAVLAYDSASAGTYKKGVTSSICDNLNCRGDSKTFQRSRECSACHAVLYCSPECQREDWHALHREECLHARARMLEDMETNQPHYSISTRLFHAEIITRRSKTFINTTARVGNPTLYRVICEQPVVVELPLVVSPEFNVHSVPDYVRMRCIDPTSSSKMPSTSSHGYFYKRIQAMLQGFDVKEVRAGVRVVEDFCHFGVRTYRILARVRIDTQGGPFKLLHCISTIKSESES